MLVACRLIKKSFEFFAFFAAIFMRSSRTKLVSSLPLRGQLDAAICNLRFVAIMTFVNIYAVGFCLAGPPFEGFCNYLCLKAARDGNAPNPRGTGLFQCRSAGIKGRAGGHHVIDQQQSPSRNHCRVWDIERPFHIITPLDGI